MSWRRFSWGLGLSLLFNSCISQKSTLKNGNGVSWSIHAVDASGGDVGRCPVCRLDSLGNPWLVYARGATLNIFYRVNNKWESSPTPLGVDPKGHAIKMALDFSGTIHLLYLSPNGLEYVKSSEIPGTPSPLVGEGRGEGSIMKSSRGSWRAGLITNRAKTDSPWDLAITKNGQAYFIFEDKAGKLILFEEKGGLWSSEELLKNKRSVQDEPLCVAFNPQGNSNFFALGENRKGETARIRIANNDHVDDVFEWKDKKMEACQLAWDDSGVLHGLFLIQKNSRAKADLVYGVLKQNRWQQEVITRDFVFKSDFTPFALAVDNQGLAHVACYNASHAALEYHHKRRDGLWDIAPKIPLDFMNATPALLVDQEGAVWLFFRDEAVAALKVAKLFIGQ